MATDDAADTDPYAFPEDDDESTSRAPLRFKSHSPLISRLPAPKPLRRDTSEAATPVAPAPAESSKSPSPSPSPSPSLSLASSPLSAADVSMHDDPNGVGGAETIDRDDVTDDPRASVAEDVAMAEDSLPDTTQATAVETSQPSSTETRVVKDEAMFEEQRSESMHMDPSSSSSQPPPAVPLRKPHLLKRLRALHEAAAEGEEGVNGGDKLFERLPSLDEQMREGLRRSLVLALNHVGFASASTEALESFLLVTETYLLSLVEDVSHFALASRRTQAIPLDFDASLARFNLTTSGLKPHLKNPLAPLKKTKSSKHIVLEPTYFDPLTRLRRHPQDSAGHDLPILGRELSGQAEKDSKPYIPAGFPAFPSIHTYRHTPVEVDAVTVRGTGLRYEDGSPVPPAAGAAVDDAVTSDPAAAATVDPALAAANGPIRNPKWVREAAAVEAKQAEEALRSLMRASKVNKLKDVRAAAVCNPLNRQRYELWEAAMQELVGGGGPSRVSTASSAAMREKIADQSMMVNADKGFHRKEIPRKTRRTVQKAT